jgi:hypothetical protein
MCDLEAERGLAQPARLDQSQPGQHQQQLGQQQQQLGQQQQQQQQHKQQPALSHRGPEKLLNGHHHPLPSFEIISKVIFKGKISREFIAFALFFPQMINVRILHLL